MHGTGHLKKSACVFQLDLSSDVHEASGFSELSVIIRVDAYRMR